MLSYRRETALQGTLVLAESGRLELRDNILLIFRAVLSNGPAGPGPRASKPQGAPKQPMCYFSSREIIVTV